MALDLPNHQRVEQSVKPSPDVLRFAFGHD